MEVEVKLFAMLRQRAGRDVLVLQLPEAPRVADVLDAVSELSAGCSLVVAVNREYAGPDRIIAAGDEVALIPPVSGGAAALHVAVRVEPLSLDALVVRVRDDRAGAIVTFSGVTREVPYLDYEAYAEMAEAELERIVAQAIATHGLCAAAAEHRVGRIGLGEPSVIVAASAPHRPEAFAGAREIIDALKASAPIWKQEEGEWVAGAVPPTP